MTALILGITTAVGTLAAVIWYSLRLAGGLRRTFEAAADKISVVELDVSSLARRHRGPIATLTVLSLLESALALASPWPLKIVVDSAIGTDPLPSWLSVLHGLGRPGLAAAMAGLGVLLVGALAAVGYAATLLSVTVAESVGLRLRSGLMHRLLAMPLSFHDRRASGDLLSRLTGDVDHVQASLLAKVEVLLPQVLALLGMAVLMAVLSLPLALAALAVVPALVATGVVRKRAVTASQRGTRAKAGELNAYASELLRNVRAVQSFGQHEREAQRFNRIGRESAAAAVRATGVSARLSPAADVVLALGLAAVLVLGTAEVTAHKLTLGAMLVFLAYLSGMEEPVRSLSRLAATLGRGAASRERIGEILEHAPVSAGRVERVAAPAPEVALEHVSFGYEPGIAVLEDISLRIAGGETACIIGPSGAGKSTLLSLLVRLHDPESGRILIDGADLRDLSLQSLHEQVGLVPQDPWLVAGTLRHNIAYGRPDADEAAVRRAARLALVDEFVVRLAQGWETEVGEGGVRLSGGQRRRVALARAILGGSPVLLLDEPTAGLDPASKQLVIEAIESTARGRTVLIVTHDADLTALAGNVVVLGRRPGDGRSVPSSTRSPQHLDRRSITLQSNRS